jgi:hypothetical protein
MKTLSVTSAWRMGYARPFFVLLILNLLVFAVYTFPRAVRERRLSVEATTLRHEIADERASGGALARENEIVSSNIAEAKRFYTDPIRDRQVLAATLEELDHLATGLGLRTAATTYHPMDVKGAKLMEFEITMPVSGTYQQLGAFLQKLEGAPFFVIVKQIGVRSRSNDGGADLDIILEAYFRSEGATS